MTEHARLDYRIPTVQSVVQLFEQLRHGGYEEGDVHRVRLAYGSAMALFAGRMHASGKPYMAHCVAAASALAGCAVPADLVIAGLLHGAYRWGDFGSWRVLPPLKRAWVRRHLGIRVEEYIQGFHALPWNSEEVATLSERLPALDPIERAVVLMRLASDLDNLRERSLQYCIDAEQRLATARRRRPSLIAIAEGLGLPALGQALAAAIDEQTPEVPPELRWRHPAGALMPPESSRRAPEAVVGSALGELLRRTRRALRR